jgi:hypothetical protein
LEVFNSIGIRETSLRPSTFPRRAADPRERPEGAELVATDSASDPDVQEASTVFRPELFSAVVLAVSFAASLEGALFRRGEPGRSSSRMPTQKSAVDRSVAAIR